MYVYSMYIIFNKININIKYYTCNIYNKKTNFNFTGTCTRVQTCVHVPFFIYFILQSATPAPAVPRSFHSTHLNQSISMVLYLYCRFTTIGGVVHLEVACSM